MSLKKFEELDWFKKNPIDINKKKLIYICTFLKDSIGSSKIENIKPNKIEIGLSKTHKNKFIISILSSDNTYIRYNYYINEDFIITSFINYFLAENGVMRINSDNIRTKSKELESLKIIINNYFKSNSLLIS